jgi:hypothetical protein
MRPSDIARRLAAKALAGDVHQLPGGRSRFDPSGQERPAASDGGAEALTDRLVGQHLRPQVDPPLHLGGVLAQLEDLPEKPLAPL